MHILGMSSNILLVIIGIGFLILVHELGHFAVAKKIGVRVHAFSIGFGPAIFKKQIGETEYKISLIPLGGYVKLAGEQNDGTCEGEEWEFMSKKPGQRAAVLVAGVVCNTILAFFAFIVAFSIGVPFITSEIGHTMPGSPAWEAGLKSGDKIVKVNHNSNPDFEDIFIAVALNNSPEGVYLEIEREGKTFDVNVIPRYDAVHGIQLIGIAPATSMEVDKIIAYDGKESPAHKGGLQVKDKILAINGQPVDSEIEFRNIERVNAGKEIVLTVLRGNEELDIKVTPTSIARWLIGLTCATTIIEGVKNNSLAQSIGLKKGDKIDKVNSQKVSGFTTLVNMLSGPPDGKIYLEIVRGGSTKTIELVKSGDESVKAFLEGISPHLGLTVDSTIEGFPAEKLGLKSGDHITSIGGENITKWAQLLEIVTSRQGEEFEISWTRDYEKYSRKITPKKDEANAQGAIGVQFKRKMVVRKYGLLTACVVGTHKTIVNVKRIYLTVQGFISKKLSTKALGGPVLIAQASYESAKSGIGKLVYFLAIISINLAVLNILPIPVLDGGHLLFLGIEKIKGSPVNEKTLAIANYIGLALILSLMIYVTKNDIMRIFNI